jgi:hypothetical protein
MNEKADVEALASLLEGSGLLEGMSGGKRSHKGQYVRWLIGQVVKRNPNARIKIDGKVHYNPPYNPPFQPTRIEPVAVSERFGSVPRSEFINRMMGVEEEREPVFTKVKERLIRNEKELRKMIIQYSKDGMTTRAILAKIRKDHKLNAGVPLSQPTITRIVKRWREGEFNDDGSVAL